ncbi:MAG: cyclic nucleotide-binding domain-containing protein [Myxococcota bacterium]|nr:cyclic nucleotide-binding domain-containing protein [Myxococcota bacterium]
MIWRLFPSVRRQERGRFALFFALGALVSIAQGVGLAGSETLFLARLGAGALPATFVAASIATVLASLGYALRVGRGRNDRVFVELLAIAATLVAGASLAASAGVPGALPALLCLFFASQAVLVNHFWTLVGDFFDTLAAKRLVPLFTVGLSLGGALGGVVALVVVRVLTAEALLVTWAVGLLVAAGLLGVSWRTLTRWRAVAAEEEDETSVAGIRAAVRYLQRSALGRWLVVSALAMVLALFVAQYLYSDVLANAFPDEAALATFVAIFLAVSNGVEIAVELWVTPLLIRRYGVATANLVHPVLTLLAFGAMAADYRLAPAVLARANRELVENALAAPVRNLVYNALPHRFRARVRAFLEGIVVYSGMSLAGVALLAAGRLSPFGLCLLGGGLAVAYGAANLRVRSEYLRTLLDELRAGRLDLREVGADFGRDEVAALARQWSVVLAEDPRDPGSAWLELAPLFASHGLTEPLEGALRHPSAAVRAACLEALAGADGAADAGPWIEALRDGEPRVRCVAARTCPYAADAAGAERARGALRECLADADPEVRAEACRRLGFEAREQLLAMAADADPATAVAALERLPVVDLGAASRRMADADARVRAAALTALARDGVYAPAPSELAAVLEDPDPAVRHAAVGLLAARADHASTALLARALRDPAREVWRAAAAALAALGDPGVAAAEPVLDAREESAVDAALRVLGWAGGARARAALRADYARRVRDAWEALLCVRALPPGEDVELRFLRFACADAMRRAMRLALRTLARLEGGQAVHSAERTLRFARGRARVAALEVLSNLGEREASQHLVLLLEPIPLEEKLSAALAYARAPADAEAACDRARELGDPDLEEVTMERLLTLRQVSLFSHLSLERLQAVERITRDAAYARGEVIMREGEPGEELMLLVEGEVTFYKDAGTEKERRLPETQHPGSYFGEMAVLDGGNRSVTAVASTDVRVLVLDGPRLRELVYEMPDIAFEIFRVLTERIRRVEARAGGGG